MNNMANGKKEEDSFNILIGLILIVFVALALIWAFSGISSCPEGTFSCDTSISSCGCCVDDAYGNPVESCDYGLCPEGYHHTEDKGCCSNTNPLSCLSYYEKHCLNKTACGNIYCCGSEICQLQTAGNSICIPCSNGAYCNPTNEKPCCDGFTCENGFCKKVNTPDTCVGMPCDNYGEACKVCSDLENNDCTLCEDNSICYYDTNLKKGTCRKMCDANSPVCPECPSGCCDSNGECTNCLDNTCSSPGNFCSYNANIPCDEICSNVNGEFKCQSSTGCPSGSYKCNKAECDCCDIYTGDCVSCLDNPCSPEEEGMECSLCSGDICTRCSDSICNNGTCVLKKVPSENTEPDADCLNPPCYVICPPSKCTAEEEGKHCSAILSGIPRVCSSICTKQVDNTFECVIPNVDIDNDTDIIIPDWLVGLKTSCIGICDDCNFKCDENKENYDLDKNNQWDAFDLEIFLSYYNYIVLPINVDETNKMYNFYDDDIIDENDLNCILNFCSGGACKYVGLEESGLCMSGDEYNRTFTTEQRASLIASGEYNILFNNLVQSTYKIDCSGLKNSISKSFCNAFSNEVSDFTFLRDLSYIKFEKGKLNLFYSGCVFFKTLGSNDLIFGMFINSPTCSNDIYIFPSKEFVYKNMAYGMTLFNKCMESTSKTITETIDGKKYTFTGNCDSFKQDIFEICNTQIGGDCPQCAKCTFYKDEPICVTQDFCNTNYDYLITTFMYGKDPTNPTSYSEAMKEVDDYCIQCRLNDGEKVEVCTLNTQGQKECIILAPPTNPITTSLPCSEDILKTCRECPRIDECNECKEYYVNSPKCAGCAKCERLSDNMGYLCSEKSDIGEDVDYMLDNFKAEMDKCISNPYISSSNCLLYLRCLSYGGNEDICSKISVGSYAMGATSSSTKLTKQAYCHYLNLNYNYYMVSSYLKLGEDIISFTGKHTDENPYLYDGVNGYYVNVINKCPSDILCSFGSQYCDKSCEDFCLEAYDPCYSTCKKGGKNDFDCTAKCLDELVSCTNNCPPELDLGGIGPVVPPITITYTEIEKDPSGFSVDGGLGKSKATVEDMMNQIGINAGGIDSITNVEGDYGGGGYQQNYGG